MNKVFFTTLENYQEYESVFPEWPNITLEWFADPRRTNLKGAHYIPYTHDDIEAFELSEIIRHKCNACLHINNIPGMLLSEHSKSWTIQYEVGAYHELHYHKRDPRIPYRTIFTAILSFDSVNDEVLYIETGKGKSNTIKDIPGEIKLFRSDIMKHGVYPTSQRRRVFVAEYYFKEL